MNRTIIGNVGLLELYFLRKVAVIYVYELYGMFAHNDVLRVIFNLLGNGLMVKEVQWSVMLLVGVLCQGALGVLV